jgi:hypothetical protein
MAFSPVNVLLVAELTGGDDVEDYYCPELEWDWDDGGKSVHEADCPEYEAGKSTIERRFTAEHQYPKAGLYNVKVTMRRANRTLAQTTIKITVRPGLGDRRRRRSLNYPLLMLSRNSLFVFVSRAGPAAAPSPPPGRAVGTLRRIDRLSSSLGGAAPPCVPLRMMSWTEHALVRELAVEHDLALPVPLTHRRSRRPCASPSPRARSR